MKVFVALVGLLAVVGAREVNQPSVVGYLQDVAIPEAERIRQAEEELMKESRIIGGLPAAPSQYPWQVGLLIDIIGLNGQGVCGGSLLSASRVVTAAHCWFDGRNQAWRLTVALGTVTLFSGGHRVQTSAVATHPNWAPSLVRNDIAVVYLPNDVPLSANIAPVSLPTGAEINDNFAGASAIASGFGLTGTGAGISANQQLSHVRLNVISNSACSWAFPLILQPSNLCTSGLGGVGACSGDSGGPLVVQNQNRNVLIGVVSFGSGLGCELGLPSVFVRVTSYIDFLQSHL